ncbi:MAG TPA: hypothetical protein VLA24_02905 [Pseudomonadales bacterium]|nr:hypothetical protein [Pseudomonadales bacterium]
MSNITQTIRRKIAQAKRREDNQHELLAMLESLPLSLHNSITLPCDQPTHALHKFIVDYIDLVPNIIDAAAQCARETSVFEHVGPFIHVAEQFFIDPLSTICHDPDSLLGMLDEAYLAHRLIEEANDRFLERAGYPLIPVDLTRSNIIVHGIIGEPYANELDAIAEDLTKRMLSLESVYHSEAFAQQVRREKQSGHWDQVWSRWPCMMTSNDITLKLLYKRVN